VCKFLQIHPNLAKPLQILVKNIKKILGPDVSLLLQHPTNLHHCEQLVGMGGLPYYGTDNLNICIQMEDYPLDIFYRFLRIKATAFPHSLTLSTRWQDIPQKTTPSQSDSIIVRLTPPDTS